MKNQLPVLKRAYLVWFIPLVSFLPCWASDDSLLIDKTSVYKPLLTDNNVTNGNANNLHDGIPPAANASAPISDLQKKTKPTSKCSFSKKLLSVATALFVGTPVCVVRRTKYEEWYGVHGMIGDSDNKYKKVLAGTCWLPFAVTCGTAEAPFDALTNGLMYSAFSKDQLSKGKLMQNN